MQGPTVKTYFAKKMGLDPEKIVHVALTPCTAKKFEIRRGELHGTADHLGIPGLRDTEPVNAPPRSLLNLTRVRGYEGAREVQVAIGDQTLQVAVVYGTANARAFLQRMKESGRQYHFVEVMACPGGCIGGGQPKNIMRDADETRKQRIAALYRRDVSMELRTSYRDCSSLLKDQPVSGEQPPFSSHGTASTAKAPGLPQNAAGRGPFFMDSGYDQPRRGRLGREGAVVRFFWCSRRCSAAS